MAGQGTQTPVVPGWYSNPAGPGQRYWDGGSWTDSYSPPPDAASPKKQKKPRTVLKVMLGMILGTFVLIIGCTALLAGGVNEAQKDQDAKGISAAEFSAIEQGSTQQQVEATLGEPESAQQFEQQIPELQSQPSSSSCIYYPEKGEPLFEGQSFQLCFDNGALTSKNAY